MRYNKCNFIIDKLYIDIQTIVYLCIICEDSP